MEKLTEVEPYQNQNNKSFNSKLWVCIISIVLSVVTVATVCLGAALFVSNGNIAELQTDLNDTNRKLESLDASSKAAVSEIGALKSSLSLTGEKLEDLTAELALLKDALAKSKEMQENLENSLDALEKNNQSSRSEIDKLKSDIENAKEEISVLKEHLKEPEEKIRIYIDQGHNPAPHHNSGATGNGLREDDITFLIGCVLADLLKADRRFEVQLSRPNKSVVLGTDTESSIMARVEGAAAFNADYLISLHINWFQQETATGLEAYVGNNSGEAYVFGESLLDGMVETTNLRNRGMKINSDLNIIEFSSMPAVLLEMGFISNSTDAALMSEHPELFAQGIYNGILEYFGLLPNTLVAA